MATERILITGANGLLGQELVRQLSRRDSYELLATGQNPASRLKEPLDHSYESLDICDLERARKIFREFSPEYVINCAAMTTVDGCENERDACWRVNAEAVGSLAKLCHGRGAHLIQLSTDFVFNGREGPYYEHDRPDPVNFYGRSKLAGENAARAAGMGKLTIIRTNVVYGRSNGLSRPDFVQWVIKNLTRKHPIQVYTDQWRTPSYTYDLAMGILRLVHFRKSGVYNLSGREFLSMYEFAQSIAEAFDLDSTLITPIVQQDKPQLAQRPERTGLVILKSETELDYRPLSLKEALAHLHLRSQITSTRSPSEDAWC